MKENKSLVKFNNNTAIDIKRAAWSALSPESQKAYQTDFNLFLAFIKKSPEEITANDILSYNNHLEKQGIKNSTINRKLASLSKMFSVLILAGEIKNNPVAVLKKLKNISHATSREVNMSLTIKDIQKATMIHGNSTEQEKKMSLIIWTLFKTGLRISEFINIKNNDIKDYNKKNKIIRIVGKGRKERFIYLENSLYDDIKKLYPLKNDYLFCTNRNNHYGRKVLWKQIHEFFYNKIGVDVHPHTLRHAFITHKIGVEKQDIRAVSRYVGHSSTQITLDMYVDTALDVNTSRIKI